MRNKCTLKVYFGIINYIDLILISVARRQLTNYIDKITDKSLKIYLDKIRCKFYYLDYRQRKNIYLN